MENGVVMPPIRIVVLLCLSSLTLVASPSASGDDSSERYTVSYPETRRSDQVDDYHGTSVADPYRWLEDPDSDESREWIEAQNELTEKYLSRIPEREHIQKRLTSLWDYERFGIPTARGGKYFFTRNDGLQNQSVLYVADSLDAEPRELLDPNKLSEDGTVALAGTAISYDGKYLAYGLATAGSDWREWKVREAATGDDLEDHLQWVKFSGVSWLPDDSGFFYSRYDEPSDETKFVDTNYFQKLYFHKLGTPQESDNLIYKRDDEKEWGFGGSVSEDGRWLVIEVWKGSDPKNQVFYLDLKDDDAPVRELITGFDAEYVFLGNDEDTLWFRTDSDAARGRIIAVNVEAPDRNQWDVIVPEAEEVIESASAVGNRFFVTYLKDAYNVVRVYRLDGGLEKEVELPGIGTVAGFGGLLSDKKTFYSFNTFLAPPTIYHYAIDDGTSEVFRAPDFNFDADDYATKQVFYHSKDGTRVPMFLTHRKDIQLDGSNPTHLYAYGGFNISLTPRFSVANAVWLEMGGVYAMPNLRGGGEYGREWHEAGMLEKKQNVFDDFIAAAEWLVGNGYTSREKLAISGRSNGGLLVGACITQRPDLYAAAIPGVGVMDMLRYHEFTIGWAWVPEYGSSAAAEQFRTLHAYSPLHNIRPETHYPATLVTTADHDDRVVPGHSFKFAAALQAAQAGPNPVLIRIETRAGHGAGTPVSKQIEETADTLSFMVHELGMEMKDPS